MFFPVLSTDSLSWFNSLQEEMPYNDMASPGSKAHIREDKLVLGVINGPQVKPGGFLSGEIVLPVLEWDIL